MAENDTETPVSNERRALPIGTRLQEFEILQVIGGGGFGMVYLALDHFLERHVALKEYMPPMASRTNAAAQVIVNHRPEWDAFSAGLRNFLNEARLLARFDHPGLLKVHRFWEENGTAYMAMPYYLGATLQKVVAEKIVPDDESSLRQMFSPLLDAVAALHAENCYHRDISPDNILLTPIGPVLLDLGAARRAIGEASQNFTAILKEGYAPLEQYAIEGAVGMRQGPWTDIYGLAGVMRYVITGSRPPSALVRSATRTDPQEPLARIAAGRYSKSFLSAIDAGMARYVEERPQNIAQFRALLAGKPMESDRAPAPKPHPGLELLPLVVLGLTILLAGWLVSVLWASDPWGLAVVAAFLLFLLVVLLWVVAQLPAATQPKPTGTKGRAESAANPDANSQTPGPHPRQGPHLRLRRGQPRQ